MSRVFLPIVDARPTSAIRMGPTEPGASSGDPLVDGFARRIRYLRVSVTDRCNYRCDYCMPESLATELQFSARSAVLTFEEITRIVTLFATLGVRKVRLTGGEPTVRKGIVDLVSRVVGIAGIEQVVMTTNGHLLADLAAPLRDAGLSAVNVSIDTLDPERFRTVTGRGDLSRVQAGVDAAIRVGLRVKTNAVAMRGVNDGELVDLCRDAWRRGATPRFIEHMPMSSGQLFASDALPQLTARAIRGALEAELGVLTPATAESRDAGPARYWRTPVGDEVGIISAMTEHFCDDCNRLRLTATGDLHACLGHDDAVSLRDLVRASSTDEAVVRAIAGAVTGKRAGHVFERDGAGAPTKHMIGIGG